MTQLKEGGCQPRDRKEHSSSASTVIARWQEMAGTSRVNREVYARFCGRLEVKSLRPTRRRMHGRPMMLGENDGLKGCAAHTGKRRLRPLTPSPSPSVLAVMPFRARCAPRQGASCPLALSDISNGEKL